MGTGPLGRLRDDTVWALRSLVRGPGHGLTVALVLALGVAAFTTVLAVVEGVVMGPSRASAGGLLAELWSVGEDPARAAPGVERSALEAVREGRSVFRVLEGFATGRSILTDGEVPAATVVVRVTPGFLDVLDVRVHRGAGLEGTEGAGERRALLTHDLWARRYGGDPGVLGRAVSLRGEPYTVVGILPRGVSFPDAGPAVWIPLGAEGDVVDVTSPLIGIGWLRAGVSIEAADSAMALRSDDLRTARALPEGRRLAVVDATYLGTPTATRRAVLIFLGAVAFTLLVALVNASVLVLTHAVGRGRDLAVRTALGSGIHRVRRQLLLEGSVLGLAGGALGAALAALALGWLVPALPDQLRLMPMGRSLQFRPSDLALAVAVGLGAGALVGAGGSMAVNREGAFRLLRSGPGSTESPRTGALRAGLVTAQIAFSFVLLSGAALLGHSVLRLRAVDPGMEAERLLVGRLRLPRDADRSREETDLEYRRVGERLEHVPGVEAVGMTNAPLPLAGGAHFRPTVRSDAGVELEVEGFLPYNSVSPGFLRTAGIEVLEGRELREGDPPRSVVVGEVLARLLWPGESAVGRGFRVRDEEWLTVVGVAEDVPQMDLRDHLDHKGEYYISLEGARPAPIRTYVVRTAGDPAVLAGRVRLALRELHPAVPFEELAPYRETLLDSVARERFFGLLMALFAALTVVLSVVGLYGLLAQHVQSRVQEIGIRMTLGAGRSRLLGEVMRRGLMLATVGVLIGLGGSWALSRFLEGMLFEVQATDPTSLAATAALFGAVSVVACIVPGIRAVRVDPLVAVRTK